MGTKHVLSMALALALCWPLTPAGAEESGRKKFFVGASLVEAGEWAEALPWLREALDLDPSLCRAHYYLAQCLLEIGDDADRREAREEAWDYEDCASDGERPDVDALLARVATAGDDGDDERYDVDEDIIIADDVEDDWRDDGRDDGDDDGRDRHRDDRRRDDRAASSLSAGTDVSLQVRRRRTAGGVMMLSGGTVGAGGWIYAVYLSRFYQLDSDDPQREWAISMAPLAYAMGITGTAACVTGIVLMALPERDSRRAVLVVPGPIPTLTMRF